MGRPDGALVKNIPYFDKLIPHIMPRRYDATNYTRVDIDITGLQAFLRDYRAEGNKIGLMDAVIAAFWLLLQKYPELNRFIVNKKIYQRNHACVSFVVVKRARGMDVQETAVKVYLKPEDDLVSIAAKIRAVIRENEQSQTHNRLDDFVNRLMSLPLLPGAAVAALKWLDNYGLLPRRIVDLSPFHTSLFITNMASIRMGHIYHHLYDFGTTGIFISLGMPARVSGRGEETRRVMTLGISTDERICAGAAFARGFLDFKRMLENPQLLLPGERPGEKQLIV